MKKIVFSFFGLVIIAIFKPPTIYAQGCLAHDSLELVKLYKATNGDQWWDSWDLTKPVRSWRGVHLTNNGCSVTEIYLLYNNLSGSLPNLRLPKLKILLLHYNQLSGSIPNFNYSPRLEWLWLNNNELSGSIPNFDLPDLKDLYLANNQLSGSIPNFDLPDLKDMDMSNNQLSGSIPNFDLPNLKLLSLEKNQLSGSIPNFNLPILNWLLLSDNQLSGSIPNFDYSPKLEWLYLNNNQLSGSIPNFNFPNLFRLRLNDNQLSGVIPNFNFPNLVRLRLDNNQLSGPIPNFNFPKLYELWLNNNQLSGLIPNFDLPNLEKLHLENNQLTGSMPGFEGLKLINEVDLENNQLSGSIPDFSSSSGVAMADVRRNHFTFQSLPPRKNIQVFFFDPQKPILIHKGKGNTIYVQAGGDLKKNTYTWYKDSTVYKTVVGDSALVVTEPGSYYCRITRQFGDFYHSNYPNYRPFFVNLQSHSISIGLIPTIELLQEPLLTQRIENKEEKSSAILFPNPAKSRVSINIQGAEEKPVTIQVFDPLGTLRLSRSINQLTNTTAFLNVGSLSKGLYYVYIQVEGKPLATKQLLISH